MFFTNAWEQRKLSAISNRFDNLRVPIKAESRIPGNTPYYGANGIQDYVEGFTHDGEFILIAEDGANDIYDYPVQYVNGRVWVNNHAHVIQGIEELVDNKYLKFVIKKQNFGPILVGGGRAKLTANSLMEIVVKITVIEEQKSISLLMTILNKIITLHQRKRQRKENYNVRECKRHRFIS